MATPIAMPQEATIPKAWKNRTKRMGKGILSSEKMASFDSTNSALLLAIKIVSVNPESVQRMVKQAKAKEKMIFSPMKPKAGDHRPKPAMKIAARARATTPLTLKQEFIISTGFSALGRNQMREALKPNLLSNAKRDIADIIPAAQPTSESV